MEKIDNISDGLFRFILMRANHKLPYTTLSDTNYFPKKLDGLRFALGRLGYGRASM